MHIQTILNTLEELEATLERLYQRIGDSFALDSEARGVFHTLAREEKAHLVLIKYQKKLALQNPNVFADVEFSVGETRAFTTEAARIMAARKRMSVPEAVTLAMTFERSAAETHFRATMKQANPDLAKLLNALGSGDKQHVETLLAFAKKRGVPLESPAGWPCPP